jgi:hypothetical protein
LQAAVSENANYWTSIPIAAFSQKTTVFCKVKNREILIGSSSDTPEQQHTEKPERHAHSIVSKRVKENHRIRSATPL